jgi:hypothetical protein
MRTRFVIGLTVATLLLPLAAVAAQEMPKPAPEMAQLNFFEGNWTCEGKANDSPLGPGGALKTTADIRDDLGGFWQSGVIKGTMANMPPFEGRFHVTFDPGQKQYTMLWVDNMGGWSQSTSSGWKGDTLVYEGDSHMGPETIKSRDTFSRSGTTMLKHVWEANVQGKWMTLGEENCTKK